MNRVDKDFLFISTLIFLMLQLPLRLNSQEQQQYSGDYKIGNYSGKAKYQFLVSGTDTIFDGSFLMQRSSLETLLEKEDASFLFRGQFEKGVAVGPWKFQFGEYQSDNESKVVDFEYRVLISGVQEEGSGTINNGSPDGKWIYQVNGIKASEINKTLFKSTFTFESGIPKQNFQIENDSAILIGRFLRNGLAHDEWSSYALDAVDDSESWYFEEGLLKSVKIVKEGIANEVRVFGDADLNYTEIPFDERFGEVVRATLMTKGTLLDFNVGIAKLLNQNRGYYKKMGAVLAQLGPSDFLPKSQVKVPYFELDSIQKSHLKAISTDYLIAQSIAEKLLNSSYLNIVRRSDEDAQFYYGVAKRISEAYLSPLDKLVGYEKLGVTNYLNLPKTIQALWPNGKPDKTLVMEGTEGSFSLPNADTFDFEKGLNGIREIASYAKLSLMEVQMALSDKLIGEERTQTLNSLEEELIAMNEVLTKQIDSASTQLPENYKAAFDNILILADSSLSTYASLKDSGEKLSYGTSLKSCLAQLKFLTEELIALPAKKEMVQKLYTDSIWNPFMANVMDEEVKKRITSAYFNILIPYFLNSTETELECENVKELKGQIIQANQHMEELRKADTRKLERKLRREKNPIEILRLFNEVEIAKEKQE